MSTSELIQAIEALPEADYFNTGTIYISHVIGVIETMLAGKVIVPVEDLKVMIKRDGGVNDLDAYCLAMGPIALTDHILGMLSNIRTSGE